MRPGYNRGKISSKELKKIEPFMAFASSALAVRPTLEYSGRYLNAGGFT
jgi:hypothetical protein